LDSPAWAAEARFHIVATFPENAKETDVPEMLRNMLIDRFHLAWREETRSTQALELRQGARAAALPKAAAPQPLGQTSREIRCTAGLSCITYSPGAPPIWRNGWEPISTWCSTAPEFLICASLLGISTPSRATWRASSGLRPGIFCTM
jgi:hypothetical protein